MENPGAGGVAITQDVSAPAGEWLRTRRKAHDLTQEALAGCAGCSVQMIRKVETGAARPSHQLAGLLAAQLGVPLAERAEVIRRLRAAPSPPGPTAAPAPADQAGRNLPIPPTALIGREADLDRLRALLRTGGARLVTLVGPPGIDKTRLALAAAHQLADTFADGVGFVELAPLTHPDLIPATIAAAWGTPRPAPRCPNACAAICATSTCCWCWTTASTCWRWPG